MKTIKSYIVTTHELGKLILENKIVPTPIYTSSRERSYIVKTRTIFANTKRGKQIKL